MVENYMPFIDVAFTVMCLFNGSQGTSCRESWFFTSMYQRFSFGELMLGAAALALRCWCFSNATHGSVVDA